jgi:3-oxoacyl-[acyl-carrier protein] reductase
MQRIAFVTGGNGGIGTAVVERLLTNGYFVIYTYNEHDPDPVNILQRYPNSRAYHCNLLDGDEVDHLAKNVLEQYSKVDVLVNNAGVMLDRLFMKMSRSEWDYVIDVNLRSIFSLSNAFLPSMIKHNYGRIINISSVTGLKGFSGKANYSASKAGIIGFTRSLAIEVASKGITVNAVTPGMIDTNMIRNIPQKNMVSILNQIPVHRLGRPEEVASLVVFLAGEESAYITGEAISISGGL